MDRIFRRSYLPCRKLRACPCIILICKDMFVYYVAPRSRNVPATRRRIGRESSVLADIISDVGRGFYSVSLIYSRLALSVPRQNCFLLSRWLQPFPHSWLFRLKLKVQGNHRCGIMLPPFDYLTYLKVRYASTLVFSNIPDIFLILKLIGTPRERSGLPDLPLFHRNTIRR